MVDKCPVHDQCISGLHDKIDIVKGETSQMIAGLYGPLGKINSGFIYEVTTAMRDLQDAIGDIKEKMDKLYAEKEAREKDQKNFNWGVRAAIVSAALSVICSVIVILVGKVI